MRRFHQGDWVVLPDGRVGGVDAVAQHCDRARVKFGADGPYTPWLSFKLLRWAMGDEMYLAEYHV